MDIRSQSGIHSTSAPCIHHSRTSANYNKLQLGPRVCYADSARVSLESLYAL